ncbi:IS66 family transposase [Massilia psychrophila]|uniref:Transposase IS66 central domain-containing protein n=1 Tax=Massilia psychrophila TaxID=1603353 RepID=A0A2G8SWB0_9BURK|nr:transposase [Massilia psychrophila]PIL38022.1 hypothetical protein CR103_20300 [Massilia psychrophila]GGE91565.1 hypothetical protein GCM10008020_40690 [Massilia psychrophila]
MHIAVNETHTWYGVDGKQSTTVNLLRRFRQHGDAVLRFVGNFAVPFSNNTAERTVRTFDGAEYFCVIRCRLDTLCKQGRNMLAVLQHAFGGTVNQSAA